jgi:hypothetical protein
MFSYSKKMKAFLFLIGFIIWKTPDPLHWLYTCKKINDSTYVVHFKATLDQGWHAYSRVQPKNAVAIPTSIKFSANPLIKLKGKIAEVGSLIKWNDASTGISANEYANSVDFVQTIILKQNIKTKLNGSISFQTCTDKMCLPYKTIDFSITVPGN